MAADGPIRQRLLDAALDLAESEGIKALTQPRVAKAAGVRQSHLTYYFPRKADLFVALLEESHDRAARSRRGAVLDVDGVLALTRQLMFDRNRLRFFLGIVLEASEEPELRPILDAHARGFAAAVAAAFGRNAEDPAALAFVDRVRGMGLRHLLDPSLGADAVDLMAVAAECGLSSAAAARPSRRARS